MEKNDNALIVLNYNDSPTTEAFVKMAEKINTIDHIIIVDNCSTDNSYEELKKLVNSKISLIKSLKNGGYAYGNNFGCKYAIENFDAKVLFISNPDVSFEENTVSKMQKLLEEREEIAIVAPIVNQGYNIWKLPGYIGLIESIFLIWFNLDKKHIKSKLLASDESYTEVGVVEGSFFAIDRKAYEKIGGFDERTFLYYEENIISKKLKSDGLCVAVLNKCRYDHFHSVSIKKRYGGKAKAYKNFYPSMRVYLDHYLGIKGIGRFFFNIAYGLGYIERLIYDLIKRII